MKRNHQFSRNEEVDDLPKLSLGGNSSFIEVDYGDRINFQPNDGVTLTRTVSTDPVTGVVTHNINITSTGGGTGTVAPIQGTITKTASFDLLPEHNNKTIICRNSGADITVTIPSGLGKDFSCNFISEDSGTRFTQFVAGAGFTLKAPHGPKLLSGYTANLIKRTDEEVGNLQGELTP